MTTRVQSALASGIPIVDAWVRHDQRVRSAVTSAVTVVDAYVRHGFYIWRMGPIGVSLQAHFVIFPTGGMSTNIPLDEFLGDGQPLPAYLHAITVQDAYTIAGIDISRRITVTITSERRTPSIDTDQDLNRGWEQHSRAMIITVDGLPPLFLPGPNNASNVQTDNSEPYVYEPPDPDYSGSGGSGLAGWIIDVARAMQADSGVGATLRFEDPLHQHIFADVSSGIPVVDAWVRHDMRVRAAITSGVPVVTGAVYYEQRVRAAVTSGVPVMLVQPFLVRTRIADRIISIDDRLNLLISEWQGHERINDLLRGHYELIDRELVAPLVRLEDMRHIDVAEGVWLDYIGRRLGFERPDVNADVVRFGFDNSDGAGFDQAPFQSSQVLRPLEPATDAMYRLCLKVWAGTILSDGTISDMTTAVRRAFPRAYYMDANTWSLTLVTGSATPAEISARAALTQRDAWPRPAGIMLTVS